MGKILIAPSILSGEFAKMADAAADVERWGGDYIHCDVMDGRYVENITFGMPMIKSLRKFTKLPLDTHLMIVEPERYVEQFAEAGSDVITFHPDASKDPKGCLEKIKNCGKKCGLVFNPDVPVEKYEYLFPLCDVVLVMTVYAGKGGQKLIPRCLGVIKTVREKLAAAGLDIPVEADGGINLENAEEVKKAGGTVIVSGSAVFESEDPAAAIAALRK